MAKFRSFASLQKLASIHASIHNHFNQYGVHADEAWGRPRDRETYPGNEGFVDASLELLYRYWNLGFTIPFSAGSTSGV